MLRKPTADQLLALGGVVHCCELVHQLAANGQCDAEPFESAMRTLFTNTPEDLSIPGALLSVYGSETALLPGLRALEIQLNPTGRAGLAPGMRYAVSLLQLTDRLRRKPAVLGRLGEGIESARRQMEHFHPTHDNVIANLADTYQNTVATLGNRIQVRGYVQHLQQPKVANRIRALLLAGVRSAILWRQLGGRRWHFLIYRRQLLAHIHHLLQACRQDRVE